MNQCRECGAALPENAKVCFQCGTEVRGSLRAEKAAHEELDFLKPALVGGLTLGVLSSLPYLGILCCIWVPLGGVIAAYLLNQQRPGTITMGDGAFGGVISGLVGAIVATIVSIPVRMMSAESLEQMRAQMEQNMNNSGDAPPFVRDMMNFVMQMMSPEITLVGLLFTFVINAILFAIFATIGGVIAAAIMGKKKTVE